ncbi:hypothetical protein NXS19_005216 [Fusarium pseudograminearum]|nr:hypothetical protein NXS19_005216 [Fusarium pseudograminearum]
MDNGPMHGSKSSRIGIDDRNMGDENEEEERRSSTLSGSVPSCPVTISENPSVDSSWTCSHVPMPNVKAAMLFMNPFLGPTRPMWSGTASEAFSGRNPFFKLR